MDIGLGILTFGTLGSVVVFAYVNMRSTQKPLKEDRPRSSLSRDGIEERLAAIRS